ncbi:hypothetical protein SFSGTM_15360 [Sulfuriferula nivalis]|uniref:Uncharacterized protein n=1 Tax=Sulfuriferula nivalis TaxID=2675298 RepID=A0A809S2E8_9PROT|nr:hypothetical protein SFSGTM_15360 [Sulfuriferula nivalis]
MALRLIEMVLKEKDGEEVRELLKEHKVLEHRQIRLPDDEVLVRILLDAEQIEAVLDLLEKHYTSEEGNRVVVLPVEATLPRAQVASEPEPDATPEQAPAVEKSPERIGREELYEDIKDAARCSRVYLAMVVVYHCGGHRPVLQQRCYHYWRYGDCAVVGAKYGHGVSHNTGRLAVAVARAEGKPGRDRDGDGAVGDARRAAAGRSGIAGSVIAQCCGTG